VDGSLRILVWKLWPWRLRKLVICSPLSFRTTTKKNTRNRRRISRKIRRLDSHVVCVCLSLFLHFNFWTVWPAHDTWYKHCANAARATFLIPLSKVLDRLRANQETSRILWQPKVRYRVHKSLPRVLIPNRITPVNTIPSNVFKIHFNIILQSTHTYYKRFFFAVSPPKSCAYFSV
jgi:hypothetical protein